MFTFMEIVSVLIMLVLTYLAIHAWDAPRGTSMGFVEEKLNDGSWRTHELVLHPSGHTRMVALVWSSDESTVRRHRILSTTHATDRRFALDSISESSGKTLRFTGRTVAELIGHKV